MRMDSQSPSSSPMRRGSPSCGRLATVPGGTTWGGLFVAEGPSCLLSGGPRTVARQELLKGLSGHAAAPPDAPRADPPALDQLVRLVLAATEDLGDLPPLQCLVIVVGHARSSSRRIILRGTIAEAARGCKVMWGGAGRLCFTVLGSDAKGRQGTRAVPGPAPGRAGREPLEGSRFLSDTVAEKVRAYRLLRRLKQDDVADGMRRLRHHTWTRQSVSGGGGGEGHRT